MSARVNPVKILESLSSSHKASWVAPENPLGEISVDIGWVKNPLFINYFNPRNPPIIHIFGKKECELLNELNGNDTQLKNSFFENTLGMIFCDGEEPPQFLLDWCVDNELKAGIIKVEADAERVISYLFDSFAREIAPRTSLHGVFLDIFGRGVMVTGKPSIGKSEIALELINRGHKFIADDLVEFVRLEYDTVSGSCPEIIQDMIEVRSLGIINVRKMFGNHVVLRNQTLSFIVILFTDDDSQIELNRVRPFEVEPQNIHNVPIPVYPIQVRAGRNIAMLIEACTRAFMMRKEHHYDATDEIIERQEQNLL